MQSRTGVAGLLKVAIAASPLLLSAPAWSQDQYVNELNQWSNLDNRNRWYSATQGSRLIPRTWLESLEQPDRTSLFLEPAYIRSFGYLSRPGFLPIGFAQDNGPDTKLERTKLKWKADQKPSEPWVGLTCSACHTSQITYQGEVLRIDGGQAVSDLQKFIKALNLALVQTRSDPDKWNRFADRVLPKGSAKEREWLKDAFNTLTEWQLDEARINETTAEYGPGRVDAFGRIYNKVALLLGGKGAAGNPPDAPVSIPFIWHAPRRSAVQYNGIAPKLKIADTDFGAVARNTGEAVGVFGDIVTHKDPSAMNGFVSSINLKGLAGLEEILATMMPPKWPASVFGKPDPAKVDEGKKL